MQELQEQEYRQSAVLLLFLLPKVAVTPASFLAQATAATDCHVLLPSYPVVPKRPERRLFVDSADEIDTAKKWLMCQDSQTPARYHPYDWQKLPIPYVRYKKRCPSIRKSAQAQVRQYVETAS